MTFLLKSGGGRNTANLQTKSKNLRTKRGEGGQKIPKLCGRHIWKPLMQSVSAIPGQTCGPYSKRDLLSEADITDNRLLAC